MGWQTEETERLILIFVIFETENLIFTDGFTAHMGFINQCGGGEYCGWIKVETLIVRVVIAFPYVSCK